MAVTALQTASTFVAVAETAVEVVVIPLGSVVAVAAPRDGLLPSHSTCPFLFPEVDRMHDNPYLHAQQTGIMCSRNSSA